MRASLLASLLRGPQTLVMLLTMGVMSLGFFVLVMMARGFAMPIEDPELRRAFHWGMGAFLVAGVLGAAAAMRLHELRACPYSAHLPGLERRAVLELGILEALLVGIALAHSALVFAASDPVGIAFLPVMVLLGFGVGVFNHDPRPGAPAPWQLLPWALAIVPLFFAAEIARTTAHAPLLALFVSAGLGWLLLARTSTWAGMKRRWVDRPRQALWLGEQWNIRDGSIGNPRGFELADAWRRAPRGGAAAFTGVRRTDWEWARAMLHEICGAVRGGWLANTAFITIAVLVGGVLVAFLHGVLAGRNIAEIASLREAFSFEPLFGPGDGQRLLVTGVMAWIVSMFIVGWPMRTPLAHLYPVSRARRGRSVWLITQAQELCIVLFGYTVLVAAGTLFWWFATLRSIDGVEAPLLTAHGPMHLFRIWAPSIMAFVIVMPAARWARLRTIDARCHPVIWSDIGLHGQTVAVLSVAMAIVLGAITLHVIWEVGSGQSLHVRWLVGLLSVAAFFGLRWWWYAVLQRFHARCDLA